MSSPDAPGVRDSGETQRGNPLARKISVLHLIYSPAFGGIEAIVINWVRQFDPEAFDVHVAYFAGDRNREAPFVRAAEANGIPLFPVPWNRFKPFLRCAREVAKIVREKHIDIIHTHAYYGDAVGSLAGFLVPVKTIATVYVWGKYELHRQIMHLIDWTAIQFMDKVTAHCRDTARKTFVLGTPRQQIPILLPGYPDIHPPPAEDRRREMRHDAGIAEDEVLLVNVARLAPEKAQDQLLRSFRIIHDRFPRTRLWIAGVGLDYIERDLLALRAELKLESAAELIGFKEDLSWLLHVADIMVHPSHVEGVPQTILAGMAAGMPIVVSAVGGVPEVIQHGHSGMLVRENDVQGFAAIVMDLVEDRSKARELGRAARQAILNELSVRASVERVERLYREVMGV